MLCVDDQQTLLVGLVPIGNRKLVLPDTDGRRSATVPGDASHTDAFHYYNEAQVSSDCISAVDVGGNG